MIYAQTIETTQLNHINQLNQYKLVTKKNKNYSK
nr:MAG TPA: hypothetical protein [Caudoviricetes sp.]